MRDNKINLSDDYPRYFILFGLIVCLSIVIVCFYGVLKSPFTIFNVIAILFLVPLYYQIDDFVHLANVQIDENYMYLKGLYFNKTIDLKDIKSVKQNKRRLKRSIEPMIIIKVGNISGYIKKFYIIPDNVSFDKKVDSKIFNLLSNYITIAKNK